MSSNQEFQNFKIVDFLPPLHFTPCLLYLIHSFPMFKAMKYFLPLFLAIVLQDVMISEAVLLAVPCYCVHYMCKCNCIFCNRLTLNWFIFLVICIVMVIAFSVCFEKCPSFKESFSPLSLLG